MAEFPALPLWTDAYLGDTTHLTTIEHGAYLLLLMVAWRTADCALPDDDRLLARYARLDSRQWKRMKPILAEFFTVADGKWRQRRLDDEREAVMTYRLKQSEKGKAGAAAKALKTNGRHKAAAKSGQLPAEAQVKPHASSLPNKKPTVSTRASKFPENWKPEPFVDPASEAATIIANWPDGEFDRQFERFRDHHKAKGSKFDDWQAAWGTWVRNSVKFGKPQRSSQVDEDERLWDRIAADNQRQEAVR